MQIVAAAANTAELLSFSRTFLPDVIILEWELPGRRMAEVLPILTKSDPPTRIFAISKPSSHREIRTVASAVDTFGDPEELIQALHALERANNDQTERPASKGGQ